MVNVEIYRPDAFTEVKSRIDSDAIVSASIKQRITDVMQLTLCAEVRPKLKSLCRKILDGYCFDNSVGRCERVRT